jgi:type I restriction enzyme M protein
MLTDSNLRSAVDALWDKLWSGELANPLDAIEQLSFLLFLKRGVASAETLGRYRDAWDRAADRTPHGTPIELTPEDFNRGQTPTAKTGV